MKYNLKDVVLVATSNTNTAEGKIIAYRIKNRGIGRNALIEYKMKLGKRNYWVSEEAIIGLHDPKAQKLAAPKLHPASKRMSWLRRAWNRIVSLLKQIGR